MEKKLPIDVDSKIRRDPVKGVARVVPVRGGGGRWWWGRKRGRGWEDWATAQPTQSPLLLSETR
jgi:hypothetical protein